MTTNENFSKNGYQEEEERTLHWADYVRILRRRWWIILLSLVLVFGPTVFITFTTSPVYQAAATIMIQDDKSMQRLLFAEEGSAFLGSKSKINDQVYLLKSRIIAELVIQALMKSEARDSLRILDEGFKPAVQLLRQNLAAAPIKDTNYFIEMSVKGSSPFEAACIVNTVAEIYQNQDQELGRGEIREVVEFLKQDRKSVV